MQLVEDCDAGDEGRQLGMMDEASPHRDRGGPGGFGLESRALGKGQVVLPYLVDFAGRRWVSPGALGEQVCMCLKV